MCVVRWRNAHRVGAPVLVLNAADVHCSAWERELHTLWLRQQPTDVVTMRVRKKNMLDRLPLDPFRL